MRTRMGVIKPGRAHRVGRYGSHVVSGRLSRHVHRAASAERGAAWCRRKSRAPRAPHVLPTCSPRLCCKPAAPPPCACASRHQPRGGHGCSLPAPVSGRHSLLETLRGARAVPGALPSSRRSAIPVGNAGDLNSAADFTSTPHLLLRGFRFRGHRPARKG